MNENIWVIDAHYPVFLTIRKFMSEMGYACGSIFNITSIESVNRDICKPSVIFINMNMTDASRNLFLALHKEYEDVPFIALATAENESIAAQVVKDGAQDYLIHQDFNMNHFTKTVSNALERCRRLSHFMVYKKNRSEEIHQVPFYSQERHTSETVKDTQIAIC